MGRGQAVWPLLVVGTLIDQWTRLSELSGQPITTCVYGTAYGEVSIVVRGFVCAMTRLLEIG